MPLSRLQSLARNGYLQLVLVVFVLFSAYGIFHHPIYTDDSSPPLKHQSADSSYTLDDQAPLCAQVPRDEISRLQRYRAFSVHSFASGAPISPSLQLNPGTDICILISVPQKNHSAPWKDVPVPGKGPDNLHIFVNSSDIELSFQPPRPLPHQANLDQSFVKDASLLYFVETRLYHGGEYEVYVDHEWANWRWANQWWNDFEHSLIRYPTGLKIPFESKVSREAEMHTSTFYNWTSVADAEKYPAVMSVTSIPACCSSATKSIADTLGCRNVKEGDQQWERKRMRTPCDDQMSTSTGRWYSNKSFHDISHDFDEW